MPSVSGALDFFIQFQEDQADLVAVGRSRKRHRNSSSLLVVLTVVGVFVCIVLVDDQIDFERCGHCRGVVASQRVLAF